MGDIITKANSNIIYEFKLGNFNFNITDSTISTWIVMLIIIVIAFIMSRNLTQAPSRRQNIVETFIEFISNMLSDSTSVNLIRFVPFIGTLFVFLVIANMLDIVNIVIPSLNMVPPTKDINIVLSLAIISIVSVIYAGIRYRKFSGWLKSFIQPIPIILPFKILDYFIKPVSLTLRLFGNIVAGFLIMMLLYSLIPTVIPSFAAMYFDIFDGILQAYIFVFLTSLYIGEAAQEED